MKIEYLHFIIMLPADGGVLWRQQQWTTKHSGTPKSAKCTGVAHFTWAKRSAMSYFAQPGLRQTRWCKDGRQLQDLGQRHSNGQQFQHHRQRHQASENRWLLLQIVLFIRANKWRDNILVNTKIWVILIYRFIEKLTLCSLKLFMHASNGYMNLIILYSH